MKYLVSREKAAYFYPLKQAVPFLIGRDSQGMYKNQKARFIFIIGIHP